MLDVIAPDTIHETEVFEMHITAMSGTSKLSNVRVSSDTDVLIDSYLIQTQITLVCNHSFLHNTGNKQLTIQVRDIEDLKAHATHSVFITAIRNPFLFLARDGVFADSVIAPATPFNFAISSVKTEQNLDSLLIYRNKTRVYSYDFQEQELAVGDTLSFMYSDEIHEKGMYIYEFVLCDIYQKRHTLARKITVQ